MPQDLTDVLEEWKCLEEEYQKIQETHRQYLQKLDEISKLQNNCSTSISRQQKRLKDISVQVKQCSNGPSEDVRSLNEIKEKIKTRSNAFFEMEAFLPKKNGLYLNLVLGNVNITLLSKQSKFAYKDEYEKFKLCATVVLLLFSFMCYFFVNHRVCDAILNFLLLWYYCTLTIRESVLITNGSRIKGWWVFHHYISAFLSGVMLTWPDGSLYKAFRNQFLAYSLYQSKVKFLEKHVKQQPLTYVNFSETNQILLFLCKIHRFCSVSAVLLSEWLSVQATSSGRKTQHGSNSGRISIMDVERADISIAIPVFWSFLAACQWLLSLQNGSAFRLE